MDVAKGHSVMLTNEGLYQTLLDSITDYAIYMLDADGHVSTWNSGAERIKGYRADEIVGRHFSLFYTEDDRLRGEPQRALSIARRDGRFEKENWRIRSNGSRFWAHVVIDAIHDDSGNVVGFAKITRDNSERMEAQTALAKAREELFQAQKMEAIGQLTGGVAHDFNNLLMAIRGSLEMLRKRLPDDPTLFPLIDNAIRGAERGAALTQRMLAFSRRQELNVVPVDVPKLVHGMRDFLKSSLSQTLSIETAFAGDLPPARTDPNQLETALLNLIVNARDAMPNGGTISISAAPQDAAAQESRLKPGRYLCIRVTDDGEGMDAETLAHATTPFFTTKGVGRGTGLGLSMVQGLIEQSGGALNIESSPGKGTTIFLWLPVATEGQASAEPEAPTIVPEEPTRPLTILAVDDDPLVLMNTTLMLEDLGHTVIEAYSAADALSVIGRGEALDLVITDHSMPQMTGSELAREISRQHPDLPVILATGYAELPAGSDQHLPRLAKPFTQAQLKEIVGTVLH
ncbi:ATP-binding protein [Neorhizobium sp. NPDC001467]|uniref:PAS domain-containing sensor histidine kinase n=1 Tax=Neorhizobium sp. NPDC001467 TaxID=3390595 RepID=UPI003D070316